MLTLWRPLAEYPVLARAGAIIPLSEELRADANPAVMTLRIFAGADGAFTLYEDDGISLDGPAVRTHIALDWGRAALSIAAEGEITLLPEKRTWHVECIGFTPTEVRMNGENLPVRYDEGRNALCFTVETRRGEAAEVAFGEARVAQDDWLRRAKERLRLAQTPNAEKDELWGLLSRRGRTPSVMGTVGAICRTPGLADCLAEVMFAQDGE